jgi:hypothetical protein
LIETVHSLNDHLREVIAVVTGRVLPAQTMPSAKTNSSGMPDIIPLDVALPPEAWLKASSVIEMLDRFGNVILPGYVMTVRPDQWQRQGNGDVCLADINIEGDMVPGAQDIAAWRITIDGRDQAIVPVMAPITLNPGETVRLSRQVILPLSH